MFAPNLQYFIRGFILLCLPLLGVGPWRGIITLPPRRIVSPFLVTGVFLQFSCGVFGFFCGDFHFGVHF